LPSPDSLRRLTLIAARRDHYVPAQSYERMQRHWAGAATVRWLRGGHVSSIAERGHLIRAITEALDRT
jgi:surfactin synthase thioesterase subunit